MAYYEIWIPKRSSSSGNGQPNLPNRKVFWSAQATQHPSHWVFAMDHENVIMSHNDPIKAAKTSKESSVIASTRTSKQMTIL